MSTSDESNELEIGPDQVNAEVAELAPLACEALKESGIGDWEVKARFKEEMEFSIVRYTWRNILGNLWCNGACWGQPRVGKTTALLKLSYTVYHDWNAVLQAVAFGLNSVVWKMDHHIPLTILEQADKIYHRVPFIISDDSGCVDNKSITKDDESFNFLKGGIDLWGTRLANLWHSMNQPSELTSQIAQKYNAELYVESRGLAKFDTCRWNPNYRGWQPNQRKKWKQTFPFSKVPPDVYKEYSVKRDDMIDLMNQKYQDKQADTEINKLLERSLPSDYDLLTILNKEGAKTAYDIDKLVEAKVIDKEAVKRLKSRDLVESTSMMTKHYRLDITSLGIELLRAKDIVEDPEKVKKDLRKND